MYRDLRLSHPISESADATIGLVALAGRSLSRAKVRQDWGGVLYRGRSSRCGVSDSGHDYRKRWHAEGHLVFSRVERRNRGDATVLCGYTIRTGGATQEIESMLPATIGILSLSAILLVFGVLSARHARRTASTDIRATTVSQNEANKPSQASNRENPAAMAMSGSADANSVKVAGR